jgi:chromate transporter
MSGIWAAIAAIPWDNVWALAAIMGQLSLLAIGGIAPVLPEMQRQVVDVHHWMTATEFAALFALAQAAPGPNMLVTTLIGWRSAGLPGAFAATLGICGPPCVITFVVAGLWHRFRHARWRRMVQAGLTPVTCGLVVAAGATLARATVHGAATLLVVVVSSGLLLATRVHPLVVLAVAAALGGAGLLNF